MAQFPPTSWGVLKMLDIESQGSSVGPNPRWAHSGNLLAIIPFIDFLPNPGK